MQGHTNGLSGGARETRRRAFDKDARAYQLSEMRELRPDQVGHLNTLPVAFDEQVLVRGESLKSVRQRCRKGHGVRAPRTLMDNGLDNGKQVFAAMIDFRHQQFFLLLRPLTFGYVEVRAERAQRIAVGADFEAPLAFDPALFSIIANDAIFNLAHLYRPSIFSVSAMNRARSAGAICP